MVKSRVTISTVPYQINSYDTKQTVENTQKVEIGGKPKSQQGQISG